VKLIQTCPDLKYCVNYIGTWTLANHKKGIHTHTQNSSKTPCLKKEYNKKSIFAQNLIDNSVYFNLV